MEQRRIPERHELTKFVNENLKSILTFATDGIDGAISIDNAGHVTLSAFAETVTDCNEFDRVFRLCSEKFGRISTYSFSAKSNALDDGREYFEVECEFDTIRNERML